jgi:hypothetical protein
MAGPDMGKKLLAAGDLEAADAVPERAAPVAALIRRERIRVRLFAAFGVTKPVCIPLVSASRTPPTGHRRMAGRKTHRYAAAAH